MIGTSETRTGRVLFFQDSFSPETAVRIELKPEGGVRLSLTEESNPEKERSVVYGWMPEVEEE